MSTALAASDVGTVHRAPIEEAVAITGNLRPIETVEIRSRLEGDLVGVYVREGESVRAGQLLARFEALEQESARRSAEAQRASARSALATAQWNLEQTEELFKAGAVPELELEADVPARDANDVRVGQVVRFVADGRPVEGRVARINPTIDPSTRAVKVYTQVSNAAGSIKGGTFATGRIVERTVPNALVVPTAAIRQGQNKAEPFVYRIAGGVLEQVPVQIGVTDEAAGVAEVLSGLSEGDRVVVGNVGTLGAGMQVTIVGGETQQGLGTGDSGLGKAPRPTSPRPARP
jgi:multidrug efflux pump subunit AcrA (membrane-fusion protein)